MLGLSIRAPGLPPKSPPKRQRTPQAKPNGSGERSPAGLRIGLKKESTPRNNNSNGRATKRAKENPCGHLESDEICEFRPRMEDEMYGSDIFYIKKIGQDNPIKVRKLVLENNILFGQIGREAAIYEKLSKMDRFTDFCLPFLKFTNDGNKRYIDFKYVLGMTLDKYVHSLSEEKRIDIFKKCVRCLKFLASHGYIHGDIKMDNFWWDSAEKRVLIFDFGYVTQKPLVFGSEYDRSIHNELSKFFDLIELKEEFNLKAHMKEILKGEKEVVKKNILSTEDSAEGMRRLLALYRQILGEGGGAALPRGGVRRTTRRKNRRSQ